MKTQLNTRSILETVADGYEVYAARRQEFDTQQTIPFRVSDEPFWVTTQQRTQINQIGQAVCAYFTAVTDLYHTDEMVRQLLDRGKPASLTGDQRADYLFVRPDMIITDNGFAICELETSPFGLALADILTRGYRAAGCDTLVGEAALQQHLHHTTPAQGTVVYSKKTQAYAGQMHYLAEKLLSGSGRSWAATHIDENTSLHSGTSAVYRGFYLSEAQSDSRVAELLYTHASDPKTKTLVPSATPHAEEKALLSFIWDKRFEKRLKRELGSAAFNLLRQGIPPTWIVGEEKHFAPGLPNQYTTTTELAGLSKRQRAFVLKSSGFSAVSSWAEGVYFLGKKSAAADTERLRLAEKDTDHLYVVQALKKGKNHLLSYARAGQTVPMQGRVRLTPYFSMQAHNTGELLAVKATACENTDFIHATSVSINTAVAVR